MSEVYSSSETFRSFLEIGKSHPPLTADEERQMTDAYFTTDHEKWKEIMILHSVRFAIAQSDRYTVRGEERVDIICRLVSGLTEAANRFDPSKGVRFLTFAGFYLKNSMRDAVDTNLVAVKTNNATMAIMDKRVDGKDKDSSATVGDFVGNFQSPDFNAIDPASEERRAESEKSLQEIIDHFCTALDVLPDGERKNRIVSAFRIKFGEGLSNADVANRIGISMWSVKSYLHDAVRIIRDAIDKGCVTMREWQSFVKDEKTGSAVKDIDASEEQFTEEEIEETRQDADTIEDAAEEGQTQQPEESEQSGESEPISNPDIDDCIVSVQTPKQREVAYVVQHDNGRRSTVFKDEEDTGSVGITADQFRRELEREKYSQSISCVGATRTVFRDGGFYEGESDIAHPRFHELETKFRRGAFNYDKLMFCKARKRGKRTIRCRPFYGNFYSEWSRTMQMKKSSRIIKGPRVFDLLDAGEIRKEDCFRISGGTIACRIR